MADLKVWWGGGVPYVQDVTATSQQCDSVCSSRHGDGLCGCVCVCEYVCVLEGGHRCCRGLVQMALSTLASDLLPVRTAISHTRPAWPLFRGHEVTHAARRMKQTMLRFSSVLLEMQKYLQTFSQIR